MNPTTQKTLLFIGIGIVLVLIGAGLGVLGAHLYGTSVTTASSTTLTTTGTTTPTDESAKPENTSGLQPGLSSSVPPPYLSASSASTSEPSEYSHVSGWQLAQETDAGFTIMYPGTFTLDQGSLTTPTTNWRADSHDSGYSAMSITVPPAVEPDTNFVGATVTVGYSKDAAAIKNCFVAPSGNSVSTSTASVNGIKFVVYTAKDAGAGQQYTTTSYRTSHDGACYAVEYVVHSTSLSNYPAGERTAYDPAMITDILNRVVGTFSFL